MSFKFNANISVDQLCRLIDGSTHGDHESDALISPVRSATPPKVQKWMQNGHCIPPKQNATEMVGYAYSSVRRQSAKCTSIHAPFW